jgi:hypothetical protein
MLDAKRDLFLSRYNKIKHFEVTLHKNTSSLFVVLHNVDYFLMLEQNGVSLKSVEQSEYFKPPTSG